MTDKNFLKITDPKTAVSKVAKKTMTLVLLTFSAVKPAVDAAVPASYNPINATTGPIAAGGKTTLIQSEPNL